MKEVVGQLQLAKVCSTDSSRICCQPYRVFTSHDLLPQHLPKQLAQAVDEPICLYKTIEGRSSITYQQLSRGQAPMP
jgi:hypothetical protein